MDVARGNRDRAVTGYTRQGPSIATGFPQACQKRVPQGIQYEGTNWLDVVLLCLRRYRLERLGVLFLEARRLYVPATSWRGPNPTL